ncbi:MAG: radical SAM protein [Magnetococcales bacterium]|nr:radical SAM protein [Magnetococcales bacterium]
MAILYSSHKFIHFPEHLRALREQRVMAPIHIRIKPTNHCNHNCWYCAYKVDNLHLGEEMVESDAIAPEKMHEIVTDILDMGVRAVTFSGGGEPLLYKPLPEVVERLASGGVRVAALTNGSNLKGRMADAFARHGTWVRISMDGWDDASYAAARGLRDTDPFTQLMRNIEAFTARDTRCVLGVSFIVTEVNCDHLQEVCARLKAAGVNHVKLSGVVVANDGAGNNEYHNRLRERVAGQIRAAMALSDASFTVLDHYHELEDRFDKEYTTCPYLPYLTVIGADCGVYTCQDKAYRQSGLLGWIRERTFKAFWFSKENRQRIFSLDPSRECRHHCVTHGKNLAIHNILAIDPEHGVFV